MEKMKDVEIDLSLALGVKNQPVETVGDTDAGANANSGSRTNTVVEHRPLPELVWSTQNGLTIKCGGCTNCVARIKPCLFSYENRIFDKSIKFALGTTVENGGFIDVKGKGKKCMSSEGNIGLTRDIREHSGPAYLEKVEETAENDVKVKEAAGEESSGESRESCNSASKIKKRSGFENRLINTSKRLKIQSQESSVVKKQDSSFMNWISNMVKPNPQEGGHPLIDDGKASNNAVSKILGFRSVFQSLYTPHVDGTKTQMENSKQIVLFNNNSNLKHTASGSASASTSTSAGCKKPVTQIASRICYFCGKTDHESRDCLHINESKNVFFKKKVKASNVNQTGLHSDNNMLLNQDKILSVPREMFNTIRRLRLSRTDILKWMNSRSEIANLEGYFLRLRLSKWEEGVGGAGYYVACITDENPSKGSKQPIRVNIGGVQCLVECRYISNCDFLEDELVAWWRTMLKSGRALMEADLTSKLEEKKRLELRLT